MPPPSSPPSSRPHAGGGRWLTVAEAVADAGLHAALVVGRRTELDEAAVHDLASAGAELLRDGEVMERGRGADVLGGPVQALHRLLRGLPGGLAAGELVTTGTLTPALPVAAGEHWGHRLAATVAIDPVTIAFRPQSHTPD